MYAIEGATPDRGPLAVLGAHREEQAVRRGALVVDFLAGPRRRHRRVNAAAFAGTAHRDVELDAPQTLGVGGQHRQVVDEHLPAEDREPERDEHESDGRG